MKRLFLLPLLLSSLAGAQFTVPEISITISPAPVLQYELARTVLAQPSRPVAVAQAGYTTAVLVFTLMSPVNTQVLISSPDPRLVLRGDPKAPVTLGAHAEATVNLVALAPHSGTVEVTNTAGTVIARVPYTVTAAKKVSQSLNLNYSPRSDRVGASYSISGVPQSPLDLRWNASVNSSVNTKTGELSGGVSIGINW